MKWTGITLGTSVVVVFTGPAIVCLVYFSYVSDLEQYILFSQTGAIYYTAE